MSRLINWQTFETEYDVESKGIRGGEPIGEIFTMPSKTVPGMTLGLPELLERYVRNPDSVARFTPVYSDDDDIPDNIERMDEMERIDLARDIKQGIGEFQQEIAIKHEKRLEAKKEKEKEKTEPKGPWEPGQVDRDVKPVE